MMIVVVFDTSYHKGKRIVYNDDSHSMLKGRNPPHLSIVCMNIGHVCKIENMYYKIMYVPKCPVHAIISTMCPVSN